VRVNVAAVEETFERLWPPAPDKLRSWLDAANAAAAQAATKAAPTALPAVEPAHDGRAPAVAIAEGAPDWYILDVARATMQRCAPVADGARRQRYEVARPRRERAAGVLSALEAQPGGEWFIELPLREQIPEYYKLIKRPVAIRTIRDSVRLCFVAAIRPHGAHYLGAWHCAHAA